MPTYILHIVHMTATRTDMYINYSHSYVCMYVHTCRGLWYNTIQIFSVYGINILILLLLLPVLSAVSDRSEGIICSWVR